MFGKVLNNSESRNFKKTFNFLCQNIWSENFFFYHKSCFPRKTWVYLFYDKAIFKDGVLFK